MRKSPDRKPLRQSAFQFLDLVRGNDDIQVLGYDRVRVRVDADSRMNSRNCSRRLSRSTSTAFQNVDDLIRSHYTLGTMQTIEQVRRALRMYYRKLGLSGTDDT